jgi:hypothetical protein
MRVRVRLLSLVLLTIVLAAPAVHAQARIVVPPPSRSPTLPTASPLSRLHPTLAYPAFVASILAGDAGAAAALSAVSGIDPAALPLVPLAVDPGDGAAEGPLSARLSDPQEALLGCGAWWGTSCDRHGIDLYNAELGVLFQSFASIPGSMPGFPDEMAALSWNFQLLLMVLSTGGGQVDPQDPYAPARCSFVRPELCSSVAAFYRVITPPRAAGNRRFGRRDFVWHDTTKKTGCLPPARGLGRLASPVNVGGGGKIGRRVGRCPAR